MLATQRKPRLQVARNEACTMADLGTYVRKYITQLWYEAESMYILRFGRNFMLSPSR